MATDPIFVDANVFLFHAFGDAVKGLASKRFLERIEQGAVRAVTSALVLNEVLFKIAQQEAAKHLPKVTIWNIKAALKNDPAFREAIYNPVMTYRSYLEELRQRGLTSVEVTTEHTLRAIDVGRQHGLLITDATHVAVMQAQGIIHVATADEDLWSIPGITAWTP